MGITVRLFVWELDGRKLTKIRRYGIGYIYVYLYINKMSPLGAMVDFTPRGSLQLLKRGHYRCIIENREHSRCAFLAAVTRAYDLLSHRARTKDITKNH